MIELCCGYLSVRCFWLYVIIVSRRSFRVNPHSIVCLSVKELIARSRRHVWSLNDSNDIRTHNHLVRRRVWLNGWVFVYEQLSGCGFESCCCHLTLDMVPASSKEFLDIQANYRVWIHSETRTWHNNKTQSYYILHDKKHFIIKSANSLQNGKLRQKMACIIHETQKNKLYQFFVYLHCFKK